MDSALDAEIYDERVSNFALKFNLSRYGKVTVAATAAAEAIKGGEAGEPFTNETLMQELMEG